MSIKGFLRVCSAVFGFDAEGRTTPTPGGSWLQKWRIILSMLNHGYPILGGVQGQGLERLGVVEGVPGDIKAHPGTGEMAKNGLIQFPV